MTTTRLRAMADACHPGPTATVTVVVTLVQRSNDTDRDRRAARTGKRQCAVMSWLPSYEAAITAAEESHRRWDR